MEHKKPKPPKVTIGERLTGNEYDRLMKFQREIMGTEKNYGKYAKKPKR